MNKPSAVAFVYDVQADLARVGIPVRDYFPVVKAIYVPLREEFHRDLEELTASLHVLADAMIKEANADPQTTNASLACDIASVERALDTKRWETYTNVLMLIKMAAEFAYQRDHKGVEDVLRVSDYGHDGMSLSPHVPWDASVHALLVRLYQIAKT